MSGRGDIETKISRSYGNELWSGRVPVGEFVEAARLINCLPNVQVIDHGRTSGSAIYVQWNSWYFPIAFISARRSTPDAVYYIWLSTLKVTFPMPMMITLHG